MCDDYALCGMFDDSEAVDPLLPLPPDVWSAIAAHLSCIEARQAAFVCRAAACGTARALSRRRAALAQFEEERAELAAMLDECNASAAVDVCVDADIAVAIACMWLVDRFVARDESGYAELSVRRDGDGATLGLKVHRDVGQQRTETWRILGSPWQDPACMNDWRVARQRVVDAVRHLLSTEATGVLHFDYIFDPMKQIHYEFTSAVAPCTRMALLNERGDQDKHARLWQTNRQAYIAYAQRDKQRRGVWLNGNLWMGY